MTKSEYLAAYYQANKEKLKARVKAYREVNAEKAREAVRRCHNDPEKRAKYQAKRADWYVEYAPIARERTKKWVQANKDKAQSSLNARTKLYRTRKAKRCPSWLTLEHIEEIARFYAEARRLTKETGTKYHVDHIVPLCGKAVSGLHVPWNLRVITAHENQRKLNRLVSL